MRNARSKSTFRPRSRRRVTGKAGGQAYPVLKSVTSLAGDSIYDPEVSAWAKRVNSAGGSVSNTCLEASSAFIRTIKNESGLRQKIKRLNLFCGSNLNSSLIPLIADVGSTQDSNHNFTSTEYSEKSGIKNSTASGDKYLDTGIDFTDAGMSFEDGHLAINTLGQSTSSTYKEWIGRDHAALGSNKQNKKLQFRWGEHTVYADNTNPQEGASMGFYLGNCSASKISLWQNDRVLTSQEVSSNSPSNADLSQDFRIFKRNTVYTSPSDFDQTINFYSIGLNLTDVEAKILYEAVAVFNQAKHRELFEASDIEVWKWANHRIPEMVGDASSHFSSLMVENADAWMASIKNNDGLRAKINRVNLFLGKTSSDYGYLTSLVPLIIDKGYRTDLSNNFIHSDYNLRFGLHGDGATKSLDTGIKTKELVSAAENSGHISVEAASLTLEKTPTSSANCLIGSREAIVSGGGGSVGMSISLSDTKMTTKAWSALSKSVTPSSQGMFTSSIGADGTRSNARTYFNGGLLSNNESDITSTTADSSPTGATISLFVLNSVDYGKVGYSDQSIKSYSIGKALTDSEVQSLYTANSNIRRIEITSDDMDPEVYDWANDRVPANGGTVTQKQAEAVNAWMLKVKSSSGLREKLKRVNLMAGSNLSAKMVPLIIDSGYSKVDKNTNLSEADSVSTGLKAGSGKSIDTTVKISDFATAGSGHISVKNYADLSTLVTGDTFAHGVISAGVKSNLGFSIDSEGVKGYVWDNANAASYAKTNQAALATKKTIQTSDYTFGSYKLGYWGPAGSKADPAWGPWPSWLNSWNDSDQADLSYTVEENGDHLVDIGATRVLSITFPSNRHSGWNCCDSKLSFYKNDELLFSEEFEGELGGGAWGSGEGKSFVISDLAVGDKIKVLVGQGRDASRIGVMYPLADTQVLFKRIVPSTQNALDGLWTASRTSSSSLSLYLDGSEKAFLTELASSDIVTTDDYVNIMGSYSSDGSIQNHHNNASRIGFYSLGLGLTAAENLTLSEAMTAFDDAMRRDLDEEVWDWAYSRLPLNGGSLSEAEIGHVNTFMLSLKTESGLRESIKRLNIFAGNGLSSAMVPLIKDFGDSIEKNYNFTSSDVSQGLTSNGSKYIDTGMSFSDLDSLSYSNFHVALSRKGNSIGGYYFNSDAIGDGSVKLNLTNQPLPPTQEGQDALGFSQSTITSSHSGSGLLVGTSCDNTETKLYKGGSANFDTEPFDGSSSISANNFVVFANQTESGVVSAFDGRVSVYSLGSGLTSGQVSAFSLAISVLEISLKRGDYQADDPDAWKWANVNVPANSGLVTQEQVTAVDKFMNSVSNVHNLRSSIKRMNLFVGENLNAALVPVVSDLGTASEVNNNFISSDYVSTGPDAGLTGGETKTLNLKVKASDLGDNHLMSFRSRSGSTFATSLNAPIMGAELGLSTRRIGSNLGRLAFYTSATSAQTISSSKYIKTPAIFKDLPRNYLGCDISGGPLGSSLNKNVNESSCETSENAVSNYSIANHSSINSALSQKTLNDRLYYDYRNSDSQTVSESSQIFGESAVTFTIDHETGRIAGPASHKQKAGTPSPGENGNFCKGFYSVLCSKDVSTAGSLQNVNKIKIYKDGQGVLESQISNQIVAPEEEIALFGIKNGSAFHSFPTSINIDFYCLGSCPETPDSDKNPDVLDDGFLPNEINSFLIQLDVDLNRKDFQKPNASKGILGNLSVLTNELDPEVSKWANEKVRKVGGELNSEIVLAVNAWMGKIKERSGLRQKIQRVNLFSSVNLAGALVPIISDEGHPVDLNQGTVQFSEEDFVLGRLHAGVSWDSSSTTPKKYLDTGLNPTKANLSWDNIHMGFATSLEKLHGDIRQGGMGYPTPISLNCGDVNGDYLSNDEVRISTYVSCPHSDRRRSAPESCRNWINANLAQGRFSNYVELPSYHLSTHQTIYMVTSTSFTNRWTHSLKTLTGGILRGSKTTSWYSSLDKKFREDKNVLLFAEHANQLEASSLVDDITKYGGMIVPSRHSLTPIKFSDGKYYIVALTDQKFTLNNLVRPSSGTNDPFKEYVSDLYGHGWTPLNYTDIKNEFWDSSKPEGAYNFNRLIKDLKHGHRYDKPIGWVDPNNIQGFGLNHAIHSTRLLLHNDNQSSATKSLNKYNSFDSDAASETIIRAINSSEMDVACGTCGFNLTEAPVLMKIEVPDVSSHTDAVHNQTWGSDITYYSVGVELDDADVTHLDNAYASFVEVLDLKDYHKSHPTSL